MRGTIKFRAQMEVGPYGDVFAYEMAQVPLRPTKLVIPEGWAIVSVTSGVYSITERELLDDPLIGPFCEFSPDTPPTMAGMQVTIRARNLRDAIATWPGTELYGEVLR